MRPDIDYKASFPNTSRAQPTSWPVFLQAAAAATAVDADDDEDDDDGSVSYQRNLKSNRSLIK